MGKLLEDDDEEAVMYCKMQQSMQIRHFVIIENLMVMKIDLDEMQGTGMDSGAILYLRCAPRSRPDFYS